MVWDVTADTERFEEAIDWFAARTVISAAERRRITARARHRAFWIAGVAQLSVVEDVFSEIRRSIERGEPYESFRARVRQRLTNAWGGDNPHRIETIFRNAVQGSYNAGRFRQMRDPAVLEHRPFWMFDAILDSRTSQICKPLDQTVLAASDPFWENHVPPLHHRCRSSIRSLRESQARRRGISTTPPSAQAQTGFGRAPTDSLDVPEELLPRADADPELVAQLQGKARDALGDGPPGQPPSGPSWGDGPPPSDRQPPPWWMEPRRKRGAVEDLKHDFEAPERALAAYLAEDGNNVFSAKRHQPDRDGRRKFDALINRGRHHVDPRTEFKQIRRTDDPASTVVNAARRSMGHGGQARNLIIDARGSGLSRANADAAVTDIRRNSGGRLDYLRIVGDDFDVTYWGF